MGKRTDHATSAAVIHLVERRFTPVDGAIVAVAPATVAGIECASSTGAGRRRVGKRTDNAAGAAAIGGLKAGFTPVVGVVVATCPKGCAGKLAASTRTSRRAVSVGASISTRAAVGKVAREVGFTPVANECIAVAKTGVAPEELACSRLACFNRVGEITHLPASAARRERVERRFTPVGVIAVAVGVLRFARREYTTAGGAA